MNNETLFVLLLLLVGMVFFQVTRDEPRESFAPPVIVAVVYMFYGVLAPRDAIQTGDTRIFTLDALPGYPLVWSALVLHLGGFLIGYYLFSKYIPQLRRRNSVSAVLLAKLGYRICVWSTIAYGISQGFAFITNLNPMDVSQGGSAPLIALGFMSKYLAYSINLLLLGILFQLPAAVDSPGLRFRAFSWVLFATSIYVSFGFRWRVVVLFSSIFILWHLWKRWRPGWLTAVVLPLVFIVAGAMGVNRKYGQGLDTEALAGLDFDALLSPSLAEGKLVFNMTALLLGNLQITESYVGIDKPILATIVTVIPRQLIPGKDIAGYLKDAFVDVFGDPIVAQAGLAVLNVGEYFLFGGWASVFLIGIVVGYVCRIAWSWYLLNCDDPFVLSLYTLMVAFMYMIISRGFTPGVFILAGFTFLPFIVFRRQLRSFLAEPN